jgi:hypothetical protein
MPPGSRQAMPMTATGVRGILIIGTKGVVDPGVVLHYVLARTNHSLLTTTVALLASNQSVVPGHLSRRHAARGDFLDA